MKLVPLNLIKEGDVLAKSIFDTNNRMLLSAGIKLEKTYIEKLKEKGFLAVYIYDGFSDDIVPETCVSDSTKLEAIATIRDSLIDAEIKNNIEKIKIDKKRVKYTVEEIIEELSAKNKFSVSLVDIKSYNDYLYYHVVNVSILSILIGIALKLPYDDLVHLGKGALFYDIGMLNVPKEIIEKNSPLTKEEFEVMKKHTIDGFNILKDTGSLNPLEYNPAYQHHERFNGNGYPKKKSGNDIHIFSRIIAVVDVYDAITSNRPFRKALMPYEAITYLKNMSGILFDSNIVNEFIKYIAFYPIGTIVLLNNGYQGFVIDNNYGYPDRPIIRLFNYKNGKMNKIEDVNLMERKSLKIEKII